MWSTKKKRHIPTIMTTGINLQSEVGGSNSGFKTYRTHPNYIFVWAPNTQLPTSIDHHFFLFLSNSIKSLLNFKKKFYVKFIFSFSCNENKRFLLGVEPHYNTTNPYRQAGTWHFWRLRAWWYRSFGSNCDGKYTKTLMYGVYLWSFATFNFKLLNIYTNVPV